MSFAEDNKSIEALSKEHRGIITQFMQFSKHLVELQIKEIDSSFRSIKSSRLGSDSGPFTLAEVTDLLDAILFDTRVVVTKESQHLMYTNVELLRQVFNAVDSIGAIVKIDISGLEYEFVVFAAFFYFYFYGHTSHYNIRLLSLTPLSFPSPSRPTSLL